MDPPTTTEMYISVDIEKYGDTFVDKIGMIGTCLGDGNGKVIERRAFCAPVPPPSEFQPRCWNSFWVHFPDILKRIQEESVASPSVVSRFDAYLADVEQRFGPWLPREAHTPPPARRLVLISDNPAYDLTQIDVARSREYGATWSVRYSPGEHHVYLSVEDPSTAYDALPREQQAIVDAYLKQHAPPHTHWAVDDAERMYHQYIAIQKMKRSAAN